MLPHKRKVMFGIVVVSVLIVFTFELYGQESQHDDCNIDLETWLACNNPRVIAYLSSLTQDDIGEMLSGCVLTDQQAILNGARFLGHVQALEPTTHLYLFDTDGQYSAYAWIDREGNELLLPDCQATMPAEVAHVLSGDVYTWKALQPGHGVVQIMCLDDEWLDEVEDAPTQE